MQLGFFFDQTRCDGCFVCMIACREWHDVERGPVDYRDVTVIERGTYPSPYVACMTISCLHCANPECATACPVGAITKRQEDGIVLADRDLCLGKDKCGCFCLDACPYGMPRFGDEANAKMQMCDLCVDRLAEKRRPVCVDACPTRALGFGALADLLATGKFVQQAEGFQYDEKVGPSVVFKPKTK